MMMKLVTRKFLIIFICGTALIAMVIFMGWVKYRSIYIGSEEIENKLENELLQRRENEMKENRERFLKAEKAEGHFDWDALTRTDTVVPHFKEPDESNPKIKETLKHSDQKDKENESERSIEKTSSDETGPGLNVYYSVQTAALSNAGAAEEMTHQLRHEGFPAYMEQVEWENGKVLYRIRVGKYEARIDAEETMKKLDESGRTGFIAKQKN